MKDKFGVPCNRGDRMVVESKLKSIPDPHLTDLIDELEDYGTEFIKLGKGTTASVYLTNLRSISGEDQSGYDCLLVIKHFFARKVKWADKEISSLVKLRHSTIVPGLFHVIRNAKTAILFTEFINGLTIGELIEEIKKGSIMDFYQGHKIVIILYVVSLIAKAIRTLHGNSIMHKDLNLNNIMLVMEGDKLHVRFIDLGSSCDLDERDNDCDSTDGVTPLIMSKFLCGLQTHASAHDIKSHDYWCLVVIIYCLYNLDYPKIHGSLMAFYDDLCSDDPSYVNETFSVPNPILRHVQSALISGNLQEFWESIRTAERDFVRASRLPLLAIPKRTMRNSPDDRARVAPLAADQFVDDSVTSPASLFSPRSPDSYLPTPPISTRMVSPPPPTPPLTREQVAFPALPQRRGIKG